MLQMVVDWLLRSNYLYVHVISPNSSSPPTTIGRGKRLVFAVVLMLSLAALAELLAARTISEAMATGRDILLGREKASLRRLQNTIGQPYLLYISAPNYHDPEHGLQHNEDGYRGLAVPLDRQVGIYRILCLGGSTTYGASVGLWQQAYPAVLAELLRAELPSGYRDIEVINGGLTWGTSAELLNHYHFKFHYYRPDLVIINEGGNDAQSYTRRYYHPDNSHWRQPLMNLRPLPAAFRWLAYPRLASMIILQVFYSDQLYGGQFVIRKGTLPPAPWFKPGGQVVAKPREIPREHLSFLHNMQALIRAVRADGAQVLLVPFRAAPDGYHGKDFELSQVLRHEMLFKELPLDHGLGFAPFPASIISAGNWTDHCHLNDRGEREKAIHIADYVRPMMMGAAAAR